MDKNRLEELESLRRKLPVVERILKGKPDVTGWGIGFKSVGGTMTDRLAFVVAVSRKHDVEPAARIPEQIEGVPTDVIATGPFEPFENDGIFRPAPGGVAVYNRTSNGGNGTLGCYLRSEAYPDLFLVSNNHVIALSNQGMAGDVISQGWDETTSSGNDIAALFRFPFIVDGGRHDCAVARMTRPGPDSGTSPDAKVAILDAFSPWFDLNQGIGGFGVLTADCAIAAADLDASGRPDLVFAYVDAPAGENTIYFHVGRNLDPAGVPTGAWTAAIPVPGWVGEETQALGIALADINGDGATDIAVFHINNPGGANTAHYRIGWSLAANGNVAGWSPVHQIPGSWGTLTAGGGIAIADVDGDGRHDLVVFFVDAAPGENMGYIRLGRNMDATGKATWPDEARPIAGWWGSETQGADIAYVGPHPNNLGHTFLCAHVNNPAGENIFHHRTVTLDANGVIVLRGPVRQTGVWVGGETQGVGLTLADIEPAGRSILAVTVDNPGGANHAYLRASHPLPPDYWARWWARQPTTLRNPLPGMRGWKCGERTEIMSSAVRAIAFSAQLGSGTLTDLILFEPAMGDRGDSGSLVMDNQGFPIGLLVGGNADSALACTLDDILGALKISSPYAVPGATGRETRGAAVAAFRFTVAGTVRNDIVAVHVDAANQAWYRHGRGVDTNGQIAPGNWSAPVMVPNWSASPTVAAGATLAMLPGEALPALVLLNVVQTASGTVAFFNIGRGFDQSGAVTGGWSPRPVAIADWLPGACQGADIAVAHVDESSRLDVILFTIVHEGGRNTGFYRIGIDLRPDGGVAHWSDWRAIDGWWGTRSQGGGIAATDLDGDGRVELIVFHVDDVQGAPGASPDENWGYWRVGSGLRATGAVDGWGSPTAIPLWWGTQTQGAGLATGDLTGNGRPDLFLLHVDNPPAENAVYYRVLYDIMPNGMPANWSIA